MSKQSINKNVAVITTTIGRNTLEKAIISIQEQTYPCTHYIFVDGKEYWEKVEHLKDKYPEVIFTFLPMNTGGKNKVGNGAIHAIIPYLLQEDIFCFLDDDNWHDTTHIEYLVNFIEKYQLDYAYSLRRLYDSQYQYICDDNFESLGFWSVFGYYLIDTNSYALTRNIAFQLSEQWYFGIFNDRNVLKKLIEIKAKGGCTGKRTTHYKFNVFINETTSEDDTIQDIREQNQYIENNLKMEWTIPTIFIDGKLIPIDK